MRSSYSECLINAAHFFQSISLAIKPNRIVEIGVLEGFSLKNLTKHITCNDIQIYDLFSNTESFLGNHADLKNTKEMFPTAKIKKGNFYEITDDFEDSSIDILHVDIANDGHVYEFALTNYMKKLTPRGVMLLEGGSEDRDNLKWMVKYNKRKIIPVINAFQNKYNILNIGTYPSLTIVTQNL